MCFKNSQRLSKQRGASLLEYVLLVSLIAVAAVAAVTYFGEENEASLQNSADCITAATNGQPLPAGCP